MKKTRLNAWVPTSDGRHNLTLYLLTYLCLSTCLPVSVSVYSRITRYKAVHQKYKCLIELSQEEEALRFCTLAMESTQRMDARLSSDDPNRAKLGLLFRMLQNLHEEATKRCMANEFSTIMTDDMRSKLIVKYLDKEREKGVIAKRPLEGREILFHETPVVCLRKTQQASTNAMELKSCSHCLRTFIDPQMFGLAQDAFDAVLHPVPCGHCQLEHYCSTECQETAWRQYHRLLCTGSDDPEDFGQPLILLQLSVQHTGRTNPLLIARMLAMVLSAAMDGDADPSRVFDRFVQNELPHDRDTVAFELILRHMQENSPLRHDHGHLIDKWLTLSRYRSFNGLLQRNAATIQPISDLHRYVQILDPDKDVDTLRHLLQKLHGAEVGSQYSGQDIQQAILLSNVAIQNWTIQGAGLYPVLNSMNHSCDPNVTSMSSTTSNKMQVITLCPIQEGEELTVSYIDESLPRTQRQELLWQQYRFRCRCTRCSSSAG